MIAISWMTKNSFWVMGKRFVPVLEGYLSTSTVADGVKEGIKKKIKSKMPGSTPGSSKG